MLDFEHTQLAVHTTEKESVVDGPKNMVGLAVRMTYYLEARLEQG